jgi:hypothetical protein
LGERPAVTGQILCDVLTFSVGEIGGRVKTVRTLTCRMAVMVIDVSNANYYSALRPNGILSPF